jgi:hypothetical protein
LESEVLEQVFEPEQINRDNILPLEQGLSGALGFVYYITDQITAPGDTDDHFEFLLKRAIWGAKAREEPEDEYPFLKYSVRFDVIGQTEVDISKIAGKIRSRNLQELTEDEMRFYLFVQERKGAAPQPGKEAAEEFLQHVEELEDEGKIEPPENSEY